MKEIQRFLQRKVNETQPDHPDFLFISSLQGLVNAYIESRDLPALPEIKYPSWLMEPLYSSELGFSTGLATSLWRSGVEMIIQAIILEEVIRRGKNLLDRFGNAKQTEFAQKWPEILQSNIDAHPEDKKIVDELHSFSRIGLTDNGLLCLVGQHHIYSIENLQSLTISEIDEIIQSSKSDYRIELSPKDQTILYELLAG